jgi:two-component system nitrate/nitrite response regulator NarL
MTQSPNPIGRREAPGNRFGLSLNIAGARGDELRILVVQDHPLLASAIARILEGELDMSVRGTARSGAEAAVVALRERVAVVLMDFNLPDMTGPAAAALIRSAMPDVAIVFHSAEDSEAALLDAIDAGATAYLTKTAMADDIVEAVRKAGRGEVLIPVSLFAKAIARQRTLEAERHDRERLAAEFTARELDVLKLLAEGLDTNAMSQRLGIATHTTEWHVRHVIEKLGVHSKLQAVIAAARRGLITLDQP